MTSLRMRVVEAGARARAEFDLGGPPDGLSDAMMARYREEAEAVLDAMLDCLADHEPVIPVEEEDGSVHFYAPLNVHAARLVRALRESP